MPRRNPDESNRQPPQLGDRAGSSARNTEPQKLDPVFAPIASFSDRLLLWWEAHGRHDLPWQHPRNPYRVWVAEIMLQQTRVEAVVGYFERFIERFPDLKALADAELDEVLACWSGLGYYARARNLHRASRLVRERHDGILPADGDALVALPGIGRSTAAAIVAQAHDRRAVILDGNVKRVLARHALVEGWPGRSAVERRLWQEAEARTPKQRAADYTQAIMDLGATVCTPRKPSCPQCPVADDCGALAAGWVDRLPQAKPRKCLPEREAWLLILRDGHGRVLLERRPPAGVWGGLWCLPTLKPKLSDSGARLAPPPPLRHVFSHFALTMRFEHRRINADLDALADGDDRRWFGLDEALASGLAKPIRSVLEQLASACVLSD